MSPGPQGRGSPPGALLIAAGPVFVSAGQVHRHLDQHEVRYLQFAFRWMNNLLMREVPLRCTIRLWDTYQVSAPRAPPSRRLLLWVRLLCSISPSKHPLH